MRKYKVYSTRSTWPTYFVSHIALRSCVASDRVFTWVKIGWKFFLSYFPFDNQSFEKSSVMISILNPIDPFLKPISCLENLPHFALLSHLYMTWHMYRSMHEPIGLRYLILWFYIYKNKNFQKLVDLVNPSILFGSQTQSICFT